MNMPLRHVRRLSNLWIFTLLTLLLFYTDQLLFEFEEEQEADQRLWREELLSDEDDTSLEDMPPLYLVTEYMDLLSSEHFSMFNLFLMNMERNSSNFILDANFL